MRALLARTEEVLDDPLLTDLLAEAVSITDAIRPLLAGSGWRESVLDQELATVRGFIEGGHPCLRAAMQCTLDPGAQDHDGDGYACYLDCDDGNADFNIGAVDLCFDGLDQDCSSNPDDGCF